MIISDLIRRSREDTEVQPRRYAHHLELKAEIGVIYIQVKEHQEEAPEAKKTEGRGLH